MSTPTATAAGPAAIPAWVALVREKVESLSYGVVQITVHDRRVTQIERTEKIRVDAPVASRSAGSPAALAGR